MEAITSTAKKKYVKTIDKIIHYVEGRYGAPMGRPNKGKRPADKTIYDSKVPLYGGGAYDKGGAYWGAASELRVSYTKDMTYIQFYRVGDKSLPDLERNRKLLCESIEKITDKAWRKRLQENLRVLFVSQARVRFNGEWDKIRFLFRSRVLLEKGGRQSFDKVAF